MTVYSASLSTTGKKKKAQDTTASDRSTMDTRSSQVNQHQYYNNGNSQQQQQEHWQQQIEEKEASEESHLLLQPHARFDPLLPTPAKNGHHDNQQHYNYQHRHNNHNRTRSVDASGTFFSGHNNETTIDGAAAAGTPDSPRRVAPGRHHHRTRSLEEWANLLGISGGVATAGRSSSSSNSDGDHTRTEDGGKDTRERELYRRRYTNPKHIIKSNNSSRNGQKPPLPPKVSFSPSSAKNLRTLKLDRIVEAAQQEENTDSPGYSHEGNHDRTTRNATTITTTNIAPTTTNDQRFAAAATAELRDSNDSMTLIPPTLDDNQSVGSNGSSTLFSIPQHLISNSGRYSAVDDASQSSMLIMEDDNSTEGGSWMDTASARSSHHSRSDSQDYATSERLAKFEKEQEMMFQQKKHSMKRELSNVLERNAVKSHREKQDFINTYMTELEKERAKLVTQWRDEWEKEEEHLRLRDPNRKLFRDLYDKVGSLLDSLMYFFSTAEVFISNMPLTIAALALSWVSMGCVWFKFMEENVESCTHVHFYSSHCSFPEFPGCFECDEENKWYILAVNWHYLCSTVSFIFCSMIMLKVIIAWDVVVDELGNPTTSTPCGVFCIAMVCVFAGRGPVGEMVVLITATFHFILAFWFLYMAIYRYRLYPDPGWFPNTVGISYAAVKTFLYYPLYGEVLMTFCLTFFFGVFFISAIRVATNPKIAAPICWFMMSAPSITLYAVTLISQPIHGDEQAMSSNPLMKAHFVTFLHHYYLPLHHFLFACSLIGVCSAIHGVSTRWKKFKEKAFSPAHVAFVAPTLSHANAIQSYRATLASLSTFSADGWFCRAIYVYWCFCLFTGTTVVLIFTFKFLRRLPEWTRVDVAGEEEPPAPYETMTHEMLDDRGAHEAMFHQTFVSPAVLEANEAGALIRVRRGTEDYRRHGPFIRTRKVTARGFDPSMNDSELREERAALLDWVAKNAPRKRNRTMSIPGVMHLRDKSGRDVYGTFLGDLVGDGNDSSDGELSRGRPSKHGRSKTSVDGFW